MLRIGLALFALILVFSKAYAANSIPLIAPAETGSQFVPFDRCADEQGAGEHNAQEKNAPASLTKIMTGYVVEEELRRGRLDLDEEGANQRQRVAHGRIENVYSGRYASKSV